MRPTGCENTESASCITEINFNENCHKNQRHASSVGSLFEFLTHWRWKSIDTFESHLFSQTFDGKQFVHLSHNCSVNHLKANLSVTFGTRHRKSNENGIVV